jgi:PadR family transcriptional regulator, regulatory protein PadR
MRMTTQTQAVLAALLADPAGAHYGLEISRAGKLPSGTLYPILARLEQVGWVESEWEEIDPSAAGRRARRYYRLTGMGERVARRELEATVERLRTAIGSAAEARA